MSAVEIIEEIKSLPLEEQRIVLDFLSTELKGDTEARQTEDRKLLRRLREVFGKK